jgi:hypothetical protein
MIILSSLMRVPFSFGCQAEKTTFWNPNVTDVSKAILLYICAFAVEREYDTGIEMSPLCPRWRSRHGIGPLFEIVSDAESFTTIAVPYHHVKLTILQSPWWPFMPVGGAGHQLGRV